MYETIRFPFGTEQKSISNIYIYIYIYVEVQ